jgi:CRP-like cAMP-binding protein
MRDAISGLSLNNGLLSALPDDEFDILRPHFVEATFKPGTILAEPGDIVETCYFPVKGMISLLSVTEQGQTVEIGYTGREGMAGLVALLGKNEILYQHMVQAHTECLTVDAEVIHDLFCRKGAFHDLVLRYLYALLKQIAQTSVCNHFHTIEERLCRWLAVMCERSQSDRLALTQEFLAHMLGVQRTSIGLVATSLQESGIIKYSRGIVEVRDVDTLRKSACECYNIVNGEYDGIYRKGKL